MRRTLVMLCALVVFAAGCSRSGSSSAGPTTTVAARVDFPLAPYRGLGTWVDVYDYVPAFEASGATPNVAVDGIDDVAALGVRTLFLQVAIDDPRSQGLIVESSLVDGIVRRAHRRGVSVVAWYLPKFGDVARDVSYVKAIVDYRVDGRGFDGLALDIEWTQTVPDTNDRNSRLIDFSKQVRALVGPDRKLGAIVYPAVQSEVINPGLWPDFPYRTLNALYDVWMPMAYWTFRNGDYRDAYKYTEESIRRLRTNLGTEDAYVHPVGGIGDQSTVADYEGFLRAVKDTRSIGWSIYDFDTTRSSHWRLLRRGPG